MVHVPDLFRVCARYEPDPVIMRLEPGWRADCINCARNYADQVCPIFRARFLRLFGLWGERTRGHSAS